MQRAGRKGRGRLRNCCGGKIAKVTARPGQGPQGPSGGRAAEPHRRREGRGWDCIPLPPSDSHDRIWSQQLRVSELGTGLAALRSSGIPPTPGRCPATLWEAAPELDAPGKEGEMGLLVATGFGQRDAAFCPRARGQRGGHVWDSPPGGTEGQQSKGRSRGLAPPAQEAVNPGFAAPPQTAWKIPQKITFLPAAQPGLRAAPARTGPWEQPGGFAPGVTFACPDPRRETHHAGVCQRLLASLPDLVKMKKLLLTLVSTLFRVQW